MKSPSQYSEPTREQAIACERAARYFVRCAIDREEEQTHYDPSSREWGILGEQASALLSQAGSLFVEHERSCIRFKKDYLAHAD